MQRPCVKNVGKVTFFGTVSGQKKVLKEAAASLFIQTKFVIDLIFRFTGVLVAVE